MADSAGIDMRGLELVCSRLCHELIGPVGAINNGVELIEEMAEDEPGNEAAGLGRDALDLIAHSARQAVRRLGMLRLAYGTAGGEAAPSSAVAAAEAYFAGGRIEFAWMKGIALERPGLAKVILNAALMAEEAMPLGGSLRVQPLGRGASVTATGSRCALRQDCVDALAAGVESGALSPRSIQAWLTAQTAAHYNFDMTVTGGIDRVVMIFT